MLRSRWFLVVYYCCVYLLTLGLHPLWIPDETRYAEIGREMLSSGDWITPHLLGIRYFEKPIAGYWLQALSQYLFGENVFAARFPSALATAVSAFCVYWLCKRIYDKRSAYNATLIYLSTLLVYLLGSYNAMDALLTCWVTVSLVLFYCATKCKHKKEKFFYYLAMGLACGFAFLTKGFIAFAIPVIVAVPYMLLEKRVGELLLWGPTALLGAFLLCAPWSIWIYYREPDFWHYFFWVEHVKRFFSAEAQHARPGWFYIPVLLLGTFPWSWLYLCALAQGMKNTRQNADTLYLVLWFFAIFIFFSLSKGKLSGYIAPCLPPMAILLGRMLTRNMLEKNTFFIIKVQAVLNGFAGASGLLWIFYIIKTHRFYQLHNEPLAVVAVTIIAVMILLSGSYAFFRSRIGWRMIALAWAVMVVWLPLALPMQFRAKNPQFFILQIKPLLKGTHRIFSNDIGVAANLAWTLKNARIFLFESKGELSYGLSYVDSTKQYITRSDFACYITKMRRHYSTALVLKKTRPTDFARLPKPDKLIKNGNLSLWLYHKNA